MEDLEEKLKDASDARLRLIATDGERLLLITVQQRMCNALA